MQAIRLHPSPSYPPYSPTNPAPSSALHLDSIPIPTSTTQLLIRTKATSIIRDALTWPETYAHEYATPGHDLSGIVTHAPDSSSFRPGDEVFGMVHADRGAAWAEYVLVEENEIALKPKALGWAEAAAIPLSAQTAFEALFEHAGVPVPGEGDATGGTKQHRVLITGAAGGVGIYLVQLAKLAGLYIVAASSSSARNGDLLRSLGADETPEYASLSADSDSTPPYDIIIDTVGGSMLPSLWDLVKPHGSLITVDSASFDFPASHEKQGLVKPDIKALFFIVRGSKHALNALSRFAEEGKLRSFVLDTYPLSQVREAYERASGRASGPGKIILLV